MSSQLRTRALWVAAATVVLVLGPAIPAAAATITVTTSDDELNSDGDCSLREAIEAANFDFAVSGCTAGSGPDTITVPAGTYTIAIPEPTEAGNSQGDFDFHSNITLNGAGAATTIVDGAGLDRVFEQHPGNTSTISGVTIQNGDAGLAFGFQGGGGIFNGPNANLTVDASVVQDNVASEGGAGLWTFGSLTVSNSTISGNDAAGGGGGIHNSEQGNLTVTGGAISGNSAPAGGGVSTFRGQTTLHGVTISGNSATTFHGGGVENQEGASLTVTGGTLIESNTAAQGGGLSNSGFTTIDGSTVSGNIADEMGGGIQNSGNLGMNDVDVTNNIATSGGGGGLATFGGYTEIGGNSTFSGNTAGEGGGGIVADGELLMTGGTITNNEAATVGCCGGGGLVVGGKGFAELQSVAVSNNNSAGNDAGGGIFIFGHLTLADTTVTANTVPNGSGGGVHVDSGGRLVMLGGEVGSNSATSGGAISAEGPCIPCEQPAPGTATLDEVTVDGNSADEGGGLFLINGAQVTVSNSTISGNASQGIANGEGSILTIDGTTVAGNTAADLGAGISNHGVATITDSTVSTNTAACCGGGIYNGGTGSITGTTISGNTAPDGGGGLLNDGTLTVTDSTIANNDAAGGGGGEGGGVSNFGSVTIRDSTISDNTAETAGGLANSDTMTVVRSTVSGNSVNEGGGGIRNFDSLTLTNSTISGNSAGGFGGGLHNQEDAVAVIRSTTISDNSSPTGGAGVNNDGTLALKNTVLANSTGGPDCEVTTIISLGYNLIENPDPSCAITGDTTGNITGVDPMLGPLADNGGPTFTHALLTGSPAIHAGSPNCPPPDTDQRGVGRPQGPDCDMGAYELAFGVGQVTVDPEAVLVGPKRAQVSGEIICGPPGDRWRIQLTLTQDSGAMGTGSAQGLCTAGAVDWTILVTRDRGTPNFTEGPALACFTAVTRNSMGQRTDRLDDCAEVNLAP